MVDRIEAEPSEIKRLIEYRDGNLIWNERPRSMFETQRHCSIWNARYAGTIAGYRRGDGYRIVRFSCLGIASPIRASRLVWVLHHGRWPSDQIDHIDHDRGNDRIENLREVSNAENQRNKGLIASEANGWLGVKLDTGSNRWVARIHTENRAIHLGSFISKAEAIAARKAAERVLGFHPNHGRMIAAS